MPLFHVQVVQTRSYAFVIEAADQDAADDHAEDLYEDGNIPDEPDLDHTIEVEKVRKNARSIRHLAKVKAPAN